MQTVDQTPGHKRAVITQSVDFFNQKAFVLHSSAKGDRLEEIDMPTHMRYSFWRERIVFYPREDWAVGGRTHKGGSVLVADFAAWQRGDKRLAPIFEPTSNRALSAYVTTRTHLVLDVMDNVVSKLEEWAPPAEGKTAWTKRDVQAPGPGNINLTALHDPHVKDDPLAEHYWLNAASHLAPDSLLLARIGSDAHALVKQRPTFFDATGMRAEQRFAISRDGTRVPYFVVWPNDGKANGDNPTILHGYGGFQISQQPFYSGMIGRSWLARGGVYVQSNIRGGGEFGPRWHQAALREKRQNAFDDYIAIAEDLIKAKITRPERKRLAVAS